MQDLLSTTSNKIKENLLLINCFEDNEWLNKYCEFIVSHSTNYQKYKTQSHHIIPRKYYENNNLSLNNSQENLINLLYKDHILAHYYLCLCTKNKLKYQMSYAFFSLVNRKWKYEDFNPETDLEEYQQIYENWISFLSSNNLKRIKSEECKKNISLHMKGKNKGKIRTDSYKLNQSLKMKGHLTSKETREKMSQIRKGKCFLKKETIEKIAKTLSKPVLCIENQMQFKSISEAQKWLRINNSKGDIKNCLSYNQFSTAGGYHWSFINDKDRIASLSCFIGASPETKDQINKRRGIAKIGKPKNNNYLKKRIQCIETQQIFDSLVEAKKWLGKGDIASYITGRQSYAGILSDGTKLHWRYV